MSNIQLFRLTNGTATKLTGSAAPLEKDLQSLLEGQMEPLLGVRFLASEYVTGKPQSGRIDSLGLDENNCPVIIEYKRHSHENVITQGMYYLDWLMTHRADFVLLVMKKLGQDAADTIEWSGTRLLCIAADFNRYDQHAIQQIQRNIELIRYKLFGADLLLLEQVNVHSVADATALKPAGTAPAESKTKLKQAGKDKPLTEQLQAASPTTQAMYAEAVDYLNGLGEDVIEKHLKLYTAFRRLKNFASVIVYPNKLLLMLKLDPATIALEPGFSRDVSQIGHWGTGNLELTLNTLADLDRAKPLMDRSYTEN